MSLIPSFFHMIYPGAFTQFRSMGIGPLTLRFAEEDEREFCASYRSDSLPQARLAMFIALVMFMLFLPLDRFLAPDLFSGLLTLRFAVMLPVSAALIALTFFTPIQLHLQALLMAWILLSCGMVFMLIDRMPPDIGHVYYTGMIIGIMFAFTFSRIRFIWAAFSGLVVFTGYLLFTWVIHPVPETVAVSYIFFLAGALVFSLCACYMIELYTRRNFFLNRLVITEKKNAEAVNRELEQRVAERTRQLERTNEELSKEVEMRSLSVDALMENEQKYRGLFETFVIPILITRPDWTISDVNQAGLNLFGRPESDLIGAHIADLFHDRDDFDRVAGELSTFGKARNVSIPMTRGDGSRIECMVSISARHSEDGDIMNFQIFVNDITEHRKLESQLIQAQKMEVVGRLAGGIAHDFNNLLTVIIGNADIITLIEEHNSQVAEHVQEIKHTAERAINLTRQLLTFSRRQIVEPQVINANDILLDMDKMFRRLIGEDVELVTLLEEQLWPVKIDPGQIEQVLTNIVVNGRDAMPMGGKLTIETANVAFDDEFITQHKELDPGEYVMIAVSDTGQGISQEVANRIFEPFYTTKEKGKGTGLGLSTCYGIVKQNNGHIMVRSKIGKGSTFLVYLPRASGVSESAAVSNDTGEMPGGSETVLIAEDEPSVRQMLTRVLGDVGYQVIEAYNGEEALRKCELHGFRNIDLLITDMVMPQMGGRELAETIMVKNPFIRTLFISGYTDDSGIRNRSLEAGAAFLQKPFSPATLVQRVRALLDEDVRRPGTPPGE